MRNRRVARLLPWMLALGCLALGAVGTALILAPATPSMPRQRASAGELHAATPSLASLQAPLPSPPALNAPTAAQLPLPSAAPPLVGKAIWQCEVHGQKIFADSPCGAGATLRSVSETNRMLPTPIVPSSPYAHYEPPYTEPDAEDIQSVPGTSVYMERPVYWRRSPLRPVHGHHPEPHGAPRAHGMLR